MAIGTVEVKSLAFAIEAADTAVKAAPVEIVATSYALPGVVAVIMRGSVDAVAAAVSAVEGRLGTAGAMHGRSVLGRPDAAVDQFIAERSVVIGRRAGAPAVPGRGRMHGQVADRRPGPEASGGGTPSPTQGLQAQAAVQQTPRAKQGSAKKAAVKKTSVKGTAAKKAAVTKRTTTRQGSPRRDSGTGRTTKGER